MFHPGKRRVQGFRCTHQLSPWLSDYGEATFLPFSGNPDPDPDLRSSSWLVEKAKLHPYSFQLRLMRYQADIEMIPTERCAMLTARFESGRPPGLLIEVPGNGESVQYDSTTSTIRFISTINEGGVPPNFATYYVVRLMRPWDQCDLHQMPKSRVAVVRYQTGNAVEARIATSFISFEQAERNLNRELASKSAEELSASLDNVASRVESALSHSSADRCAAASKLQWGISAARFFAAPSMPVHEIPTRMMRGSELGIKVKIALTSLPESWLHAR